MGACLWRGGALLLCVHLFYGARDASPPLMVHPCYPSVLCLSSLADMVTSVANLCARALLPPAFWLPQTLLPAFSI